jgi:putative addiction module component (TIGR02574 family)
MQSDIHEILEQISKMPVTEKFKLVDSILAQLDKPDPEIDKIWAQEAERRWKSYKEGKTTAVPYDDVMGKYRKK